MLAEVSAKDSRNAESALRLLRDLSFIPRGSAAAAQLGRRALSEFSHGEIALRNDARRPDGGRTGGTGGSHRTYRTDGTNRT